MNKLRFRLGLGFMFLATGFIFDKAISARPYGEYWDMAYFGSAATVDWMMLRLCGVFIKGKLQRDVEALCIASIVTNALGFALYMADSPPDLYNWVIRVINYVLAIRLIFMGGGDALNYSHWHRLVRGVAARCAGNLAKEAQR